MSLIALAAALCSPFFCLLCSLIELAWLGSSFVPVNFCFEVVVLFVWGRKVVTGLDIVRFRLADISLSRAKLRHNPASLNRNSIVTLTHAHSYPNTRVIAE